MPADLGFKFVIWCSIVGVLELTVVIHFQYKVDNTL